MVRQRTLTPSFRWFESTYPNQFYAVLAQLAEHFLGKEEVDGSSPLNSSILVILNSCTPLKARSYGLYLHFRDENFKVKTMAVFSPFSSTERIRTDAKEYLGKI